MNEMSLLTTERLRITRSDMGTRQCSCVPVLCSCVDSDSSSVDAHQWTIYLVIIRASSPNETRGRVSRQGANSPVWEGRSQT